MDEIIKEEASFFSVKAIIKELKRHFIKIMAVVVAFAVLGGVYGLFFADLSFTSEASLVAYDDGVYADENEEIDVIQRAASTVAGMLREATVVNVYDEAVKTLETKGIEVTVESLREEITNFARDNRMNFKRTQEYVSEYVKTQDGSYRVILKIKEPMIPQSLLEIKLKTPTRHTAIATCKKWQDNAPNVFEYIYDNVIDN